MPKSEKVSKPRVRVTKNTRTEVMHDSRTSRQDQKTKAEIDAEIDELLDDIDAVLEENAEEFVNSYRQHGGQ